MGKRLLAAAVAATLFGTAQLAMADPATTVGGKLYFDFTGINTKNNGQTVDPNGYGVDVKRFYLSFDHKFDDAWSANLTTDFRYQSSDGITQVFVKKAYVQYKFAGNNALRLGSADMPWIPYAEHQYHFRYLENTIIDRLHFGNSADWGAHVLGKSSSGMINYQVSLVNGGGYKNPSRSKSMDLEGRIGFTPIPGLNIALGGYTGKRGKDTEANPATHTADRYDVLAAYYVEKFGVGVEYFNANDWNNVTTAQTDSADGYSVWGQINATPEITVFARYDYAKPSKDINSSLKDKYYNAGVQFLARKNIKFAIAYKHESLTDDFGTDKKSDEFGVWAEVKF